MKIRKKHTHTHIFLRHRVFQFPLKSFVIQTRRHYEILRDITHRTVVFRIPLVFSHVKVQAQPMIVSSIILNSINKESTTKEIHRISVVQMMISYRIHMIRYESIHNHSIQPILHRHTKQVFVQNRISFM